MNTFAIILFLAQAASQSPATPAPEPAATAAPAGPSVSPRPVPPRKLTGGFGLKPGPRGAEGATAINENAASPAARGTFNIAGPRIAPSAEPQPAGQEGAARPSEEAVWRGRVAKLRADLEQAQKDYARADAANTVVGWGKRDATYETLMAIRNAALTPFVTRLMEIRAALDALPEECRKTHGCQPGWLR